MKRQTPWERAAARALRRGHLWIPGDRVEIEGKTFRRGPMYVEWEPPPNQCFTPGPSS